MPTCDYCRPWAATSREQLEVRKRNLMLGGNIFNCPRCNQTDWALTKEFIVERGLGPTKPERWWWPFRS